MKDIKQMEIWFATGSQHLYGEKTLQKVAEHSQIIAKAFNDDAQVPVAIVYKPTVKTPDEIYALCQDANIAKNCIGIIALSLIHISEPTRLLSISYAVF